MGMKVLSHVLTAQHRNRASIARALGVSKVSFHEYEHGRTRTPQHVRAELADLTGEPESVLFDEEGRAR